MEVHDDYVPAEQFTAFLETMPQVCVEVVLETDDGFLLGKRTGKPRLWFWPGSRLYKGESLEAAAHRVAREELGIEVTLLEQFGIHTHFWEADQVGEEVSRHTVNIVYHATPATEGFDVQLDDQHSEYRFVTDAEDGLHEYVQEYFTAHGLGDN